MAPIDRRSFLRAGIGVAAVAISRPFAAATPAYVGAGAFTRVYDPTPTGSVKQYINDHTFVRASTGEWHLFGITGQMGAIGNEVNFAHATAPALYGPWTRQPYALTADRSYYGETQIWAPHVILVDGTYHMFYCSVRDNGFGISLATSTDLVNWTKRPAGPLFYGNANRDPYVTRIGNQWVMYYCEVGGGDHHIVGYRTSTDLVNWSAQQVAYTDPSTTANTPSTTESPTVIQRDGYSYLFIGPKNGYEGTDVLRSTNPFSFSYADLAGHIPGHAAEVIDDGGTVSVSACGWFEHGVSLAPLEWRSAAAPWQTRDNPVAQLGAGGLLHVFALEPGTSRILHRAQTANAWSDWEVFSDPVGAVPTACRSQDGRLEVFAVGPNGNSLLHRVQNADGSWRDWSAFGGPAGAAPAVARRMDGALEAFALGPGGAYIARRAQNRANATETDWTAWETFGTAAGSPPVVGTNADGRLEVFALGPAGAYVAHRWQDGDGVWRQPWDASFGGPAATAVTVTRDGRGLLNVFALDAYGGGSHCRTQSVPSGGWNGWTSVVSGWVDLPPTAIPSQDGRLEMFWTPVGREGVLHRYQTSTTTGAWSAPETFSTDTVAATPSAVMDSAGRIHVFAVRPDGTLLERVQTAPSSGWAGWTTFGDRKIAVVPAGSVT
ncbi:family 43 glycosylhydrolase [Fodinicola acaciae]|uniref:family 43 glycosylhydrolase n=1 Tax=Fodinicola acaciae TaxID=2681555 RepID=UPI0013D33CDC|nr:family 43 glycosylhydrolase [Fodinicola acaciae]